MTFVVVGGGPTGVELSGALPFIAKKALGSGFQENRHAQNTRRVDRSRTADSADLFRKIWRRVRLRI